MRLELDILTNSYTRKHYEETNASTRSYVTKWFHNMHKRPIFFASKRSSMVILKVSQDMSAMLTKKVWQSKMVQDFG